MTSIVLKGIVVDYRRPTLTLFHLCGEGINSLMVEAFIKRESIKGHLAKYFWDPMHDT